MAVKSALAQTYNDFEIIVVNFRDHSEQSPNQFAKISNFSCQHMSMLHIPNSNFSKAVNYGVANARHPLIAFLNADDAWEPHYLEDIVRLSDKHPNVNCFGSGYQFMTHDGEFRDAKVNFPKDTNINRISNRYFETSALGDQPFVISSFSIKRDTFKRIGGFKVEDQSSAELDFFSRLALNEKIVYNPNISVFNYLDMSKRITESNVPREECLFSKNLYKKALQEISDEHLRRSIIDYTAAHLFHIVSLNIKLGRTSVARDILLDERCKRHPLRFFWWYIKLQLCVLFSR